MMKVHLKAPAIKPWQIMVTIVALALGMLITYQFQVAEDVRRDQVSQAERVKGLQEILERTEKQRAEGEKEVAELRKQVDGFVKAVTANQLIPDSAVKDLDTYRMLAGLVPVEGPGVILTIDDSKSKLPLTTKELLDIVNILRYAGAEAIDINGQRVVAGSEIHVAGNNILINRVPVVNTVQGTSYRIAAIGDPSRLEQFLKVTDGLLSSLKPYNIEWKIQQVNSLTVPPVSGGNRFKLAQPVKDKIVR